MWCGLSSTFIYVDEVKSFNFTASGVRDTYCGTGRQAVAQPDNDQRTDHQTDLNGLTSPQLVPECDMRWTDYTLP